MNPIQDLAIQANGYQQMYNDGQITAEEYKELINDMNIVGRINANADQPVSYTHLTLPTIYSV